MLAIPSWHHWKYIFCYTVVLPFNTHYSFSQIKYSSHQTRRSLHRFWYFSDLQNIDDIPIMCLTENCVQRVFDSTSSSFIPYSCNFPICFKGSFHFSLSFYLEIAVYPCNGKRLMVKRKELKANIVIVTFDDFVQIECKIWQVIEKKGK